MHILFIKFTFTNIQYIDFVHFIFLKKFVPKVEIQILFNT